MAIHALTGSRIRERRVNAGMKQSALAQTVGISPSYLNLIEHNRRRIGGKLLGDLAEALQIDVAGLTDGAGEAVLAALQDAAAEFPEVGAEVDHVEEFAGRYPGWAALLMAMLGKVRDQERALETLAGRAVHDTHLAASLHELLSNVTAIGSAASILVETREIEAEWRERFHRNIHEDSQRLAESSQALVAYLEGVEGNEGDRREPLNELEDWLEPRDFHIPELERALPPSDTELFQAAPGISTDAARQMAAKHFERYRQDAAQMPLREIAAAAETAQFDPVALARQFHTNPGAVLRRLGCLPTPEAQGRLGFVTCDSSGTLTFRKPTEGFALPRYGATCPLWPLYQALARPMTPIRVVVETTGRDVMRFLTFAYAQPIHDGGFDTPPVHEATMLIIPSDRCELPAMASLPLGVSCRICPRETCDVRREATVLQLAKH